MTSIDIAVKQNITYKMVLSQHAATKKTMVDMITDPDVMAKNFGMVSPPVLGLSLKAFFNYFAQQTFLLGPALCQGKLAIKHKLESKAHFGKLSIGFQVIGQASAAYSYVALFQATRPWEGGMNLEAFAFLVSQHSSSTTIIVGLSNNLIMPHFVDTLTEARIAKSLTATGLFIGIPLWASIAVAGCPYNLMYIIALLAFGIIAVKKLADEKADVCTMTGMVFGCIDDDRANDAMSRFFVLFFGTLILSLIWLAVGMWTHPWYSFANLGAFCVELAFPLICMSVYFFSEDCPGGLNLQDSGVGYSTFFAFANALIIAYLASMIIPTAILNAHGYATDAAPLAFWGKKINAYFTYTFVFPAASGVSTTTGLVTKYSHVIAVWLSQIIGLPA